VALRFLTRRASLFAIPKSANAEHAEENAGGGALDLTDAELAPIDAAFPLDRRARPLPML
jgi:diketogulonate reductase-like aldo/keto reductase